ncbi:MAG TPA: AMP-binding protein [Ktedonobacteraceae bacterium]|nr:AMP-binding protein [Ktedonobacteraceae bacterium]
MQTIPLLFANAVERFGMYPALIEPTDDNEVSTLTYQTLQERVQRFAGYLQQQGFSKGERMMIWSPSRIDWMVTYLAALMVGLVVVPLDINTKEDFLQRLAETTEARYLVTTQKQYKSLKQPPVPLIDIDQLPEGPFDATRLPSIDENDLAELVFTSGTTGQPKGVMLSHRNIVSNATTALQVVNIQSKDRALSILPLSHMFELTIEMAIFHIGASNVYARTLSPETLFRLLATQHVTLMVLVPQALQLFLNGIEREVRRQKKEKQWAMLHSIAAHLPFGVRRYLFGTVHKRFGGQFRFFVSGGAYLPPQIGRTWENMGFRVLQGYGATECAPVISATPYHDHNLESVGKPLPGVEVRIADDGEILVHGPNVALGYWKNPEATEAVFRDGWYYTGDLGYMDSHGNLYLKGRKKNLIVLANGMNVYPEDVENVLQGQSGVKEAIVCGLPGKDKETEVHAVLLMDDPSKAKDAVRNANKQLASHQQIRGFTLWTGEDFPRTHTLKVKRPEVLATLEDMRAEHKGS